MLLMLMMNAARLFSLKVVLDENEKRCDDKRLKKINMLSLPVFENDCHHHQFQSSRFGSSGCKSVKQTNDES